MFERIIPPIDASKFRLDLKPDGLNPLAFFHMVNYDYDINKIIQHEFETFEKLDNRVVHAYLKSDPQKVNRFNHNIENYVMDYNELPYREELYDLG